MSSFKPNLGFAAAFALSADWLSTAKNVADLVRDEAQRIATAEAYDTGAYRDGIESAVGVESGVLKGRVNANDWKSHFIEFGTVHRTPEAPLRRAAESVVGTEQMRGSE